MKQSRKKTRLLLLVTVMFLAQAFLAMGTIKATTQADYPFKTGPQALVNGVTWTGPKNQYDYWQFFQVGFDQGTVNLQNADYLAIQIKMNQGNPGFTYGLLENGDRYGTAGAGAAGVPKFMTEDGTITNLGEILFGAVWIPNNPQGVLLLPMSSLKWQWNNNASDLSKVSSFYMTTNSLHNWDWIVSIGEIGYYVGDPANGGTFTKLVDLSNQAKPNQYYYDSQATTQLNLQRASYPHSVLDTAFNGGVKWTNTLQSPSVGTTWQALFANFKNPVDLSNAKYLAVQFNGNLGAPGLTWAMESGAGTRYATVSDGKPIYFMEQNGLMRKATDVLYGAVTLPQGTKGVVLIPISSLVYQFGNTGNTLATAKNLILTTNSQYNYNFAVSIGSIGYYNGDIGDALTVYTPIEIDYFFNAIPADSTMETIQVNHYPFGTDEKAFNGGVTWTGPTVASINHTWETLFANFKTPVDLRNATYLAVQFRGELGTPGFTWGMETGDARFSTTMDGKKIYFMDEATGLMSEINAVLYNAISVPQGKVGVLLIPMTAIGYQFGGTSPTLETVRNVLLTTNSYFNYGWKVSIGGIGYYTGEIGADGTTFTPIEVEYYYNAGPNCTLEIIDVQDWQMPTGMAYPFRTGELAYENGKIWVAPATGATADDWQTLQISFDTSSVNFNNASYLAIQFANTIGSPGLTIGLQTGAARYSLAGIQDGSKIYYIKESGEIATAGFVLYGSITTSISSGTLLIPMSALGWQWDPGTQTLESVTSLIITTNRRYNFNFQVKFGEIGFYTGEIGEPGTTFTKILDLSEDKSNKFQVSGSVTNESTLIRTTERTIYGDTVINVTATGKSPANYGIWTGGSFGQVTMTTDTYGDTAAQFKATGSNPTGDAFTAIDIANAGGFTWAGKAGVTFWARNDSDREISFNIEVDCRIVATGVSDRFNIQQGHRYFLYDVNTNKTYIYMTKPTATLPVGFEGWVRIPFTAFERAAWSNNGVTKASFMAEGTVVSYLAITVHSSTYLNLPFSLNKFGSYSITPSFISPFVVASPLRKTIIELMEIEE